MTNYPDDPARKINIKYYENAITDPIDLGTYPLDENKSTNISFSQEWWNPVKEAMGFLKTVLDSMDVNIISAAASLATDLPKLFGMSLKPLNYYSKAWENPGNPFQIALSLSFRFGWKGVYNAYHEVITPTMELIKRTLPVLTSDSNLGYVVQGPGPTPLDIFLIVASEITELQKLLPGKSAADKDVLQRREDALKDAAKGGYNSILNLEGSSLINYTATKTEVTNIIKTSRNDFDKIKQEELNNLWLKYLGSSPETLKSYYFDRLNTIDKLLKKDDTTTEQMPRTWQLTLGNYIFRYLVCTSSEFVFFPEVDSNGYPIHSELNLSFQPYLIALANSLGTPYTGENATSSYGWHA